MKEQIFLLKGDITRLKVDAIVNAANSSLMGGGGVDGAIHRAGGPAILDDCRKIIAKQGSCKTGEAVITTAGNLPAKFVIHTVGPVWNNGKNSEAGKLSNCYKNSLALAIQHKITSIAFPNISTGIYGYPKKEAARIAIQTVTDFLINNQCLMDVHFICFDEENYFIYQSIIDSKIAPRSMKYQQTIDYLFTRLPLFSRIGAAAYKPSLDNTIRLCESLDNPHTKFKSVHIAGTNGKGSVSHMLAAILQMAGYKTGLYTSPHLKDFRERIRVNGEMVSEEFVIGFTEKINPLIEEIEPSFFEITVAMAFDYFAQEKCDVAIIETGLGGRLDSTNIITPELSVITNIGWDHMNLLGDSLEKIAAEKAGIIKYHVPVIVGEVLKETSSVFEKVAHDKNASLTIASQKRQALEWKWQKHELIVEVSEEHKTDHKVYHLDLAGLYQTKNLLTVLEACSQLQQKGWNIEDNVIHKALQQVKKLTGLHGRWDVIHEQPLIVLDVGHNEDGIKQILEQVEVTDHHELHIILGMVNDKEIDKVLRLLPKTAHYYFTQAQIPRAFPAQELYQKASTYKLNGKYFPDVNTALKEVKVKAHKNDLVIVCGSVFLVGEVDY